MLKDYINPSKLIDDMFENTDMTVSTFQIARALLGVADKLSFDGEFPVIKLAASSLMNKAKVTNKRTFYSSIDWLEKHGLLETKSNGRTKAPDYILHFKTPLNTTCGKLPQDVPQELPQDVPQKLPQKTAPYKDRQDGFDRHVVVVQVINKGVHEALLKNGFEITDTTVDTVVSRLTPLVDQFTSPQELVGLFNYVLHDAVLKQSVGSVKAPINYALSVMQQTISEGTRSLNDFIAKDEQLNSSPRSSENSATELGLPNIATDVDIMNIDLDNL